MSFCRVSPLKGMIKVSSGNLVGSSEKVVGNEKVKERRRQSTEEVVHMIVEFIYGVQRQ